MQMNAAPGQGEIWSVTRVIQQIQLLFAQHLPPLWVEGEISNYSRSAAGHRYFSIKDERNQLKAAFFKGRARGLKFEPEDGQKVVILGQLDLYGPRGECQFIVDELHPVGAGELELAFKQLHARLSKEGLFDDERKQPIPVFPRRIGLVTSATSAAVRDMIKVLRRRAPHVEIVLSDTRVQGDQSVASIVASIQRFNHAGRVDLLLVGRGGGSLEDLWSFNEEDVVRAVVASNIPIISGVGHEVDTTLCDLAADLRAPTPSAAAELAVRHRDEWLALVKDFGRRMHSEVVNGLSANREKVFQLTQRYGFRRPQDALLTFTQTVDRLTRRLLRQGETNWRDRLREFKQICVRPGLARPHVWLAPHHDSLRHIGSGLAAGLHLTTAKSREMLARTGGALDALSPRAVLDRGYAIALDASGRVIKSVDQVSAGAAITTVVSDGRIVARVQSREKKKWP